MDELERVRKTEKIELIRTKDAQGYYDYTVICPFTGSLIFGLRTKRRLQAVLTSGKKAYLSFEDVDEVGLGLSYIPFVNHTYKYLAIVKDQYFNVEIPPITRAHFYWYRLYNGEMYRVAATNEKQSYQKLKGLVNEEELWSLHSETAAPVLKFKEPYPCK